MDGPFMLREAHMRRIEPFFPLSHGIPRVDDRRIVSAIINVIKHDSMWRDAPKACVQTSGSTCTCIKVQRRWSNFAPGDT
jgi:transposase